MTLHEKLLELQKSVDYLQKRDYSSEVPYAYVSSSDALSAVRAKMNELGVLLVPSIQSAVLHLNSSYGGKQHTTEMLIDFTWVNAEQPEDTLVCHWYGQGIDPGEKGVGKALTYAEKYIILKFFHVPTDVDDPDAYHHKGEMGPAAKSTKPASSGRGEDFFDQPLSHRTALKPATAKSEPANRPRPLSGVGEEI